MFILACFLLMLIPSSIADGDDDDDDKQIFGMDAEGLGEVALWTFIFTLSIIIWKPAHIWLQKNTKNIFENPKEVKKSMRVVNKFYMRAHYWIGLLAVVAGGVHGMAYLGEEDGWMYWAGWGGMILMSISGSLMLWKWPPRQVRKGARLLHAQRVILVVTIVLLLVAHD